MRCKLLLTCFACLYRNVTQAAYKEYLATTNLIQERKLGNGAQLVDPKFKSPLNLEVG